MMHQAIKASVIVPTFNGAHKIRPLMDALLDQSEQNFEIIVVIDGSSDNTEAVLEPYRKKFAAFRIVRQENRGRAVVRNNGANLAAAECLIFYDDDVEPSRDSVERHLAFQASHEALLCGHLTDEVRSDATDVQRYKAYLTAVWTSRYPACLTRMTLHNLFFTAANFSVPRRLFRKLNGFDARLRDGEDFDLAVRAIREDIPVFFDKSITGLSRDQLTCSRYIRRLREYGQAHQFLRAGGVMTGGSTQSFAPVKRIMYKFFAHPAWVRWIDRGIFVPAVPRMLRYRLYSIVIQSLANEYPAIRL